MIFNTEEPVPGADKDELVAVVDETGQVVNAALRSRVREKNLLHASTAILLRNSVGEIYVHQRSPEKDWRPAHYDAANGGVILLGEEPLESGLRELYEELGISGVKLTPLGTSLYQDNTVRVFEWVYELLWDGEMEFRDQEVVWGEWMTMAKLKNKLVDPDWPFVPDTRYLLEKLAIAGVPGYTG